MPADCNTRRKETNSNRRPLETSAINGLVVSPSGATVAGAGCVEAPSLCPGRPHESMELDFWRETAWARSTRSGWAGAAQGGRSFGNELWWARDLQRVPLAPPHALLTASLRSGLCRHSGRQLSTQRNCKPAGFSPWLQLLLCGDSRRFSRSYGTGSRQGPVFGSLLPAPLSHLASCGSRPQSP